MHKIMIVDDNMTNLIMAKKALEDLYEIVPVSSGQMALEFLKDMPEPPDVVLLDVDMPDINGFYVISEMKTRPKLVDIPVIFLTAQEDATTELEGYSLGAVDYIRKPFSASLLRKRIDVHIGFLEEKRHLLSVNKALSENLNEKIHNIVELEYAFVEMFGSLMSNRYLIMAEHSTRVEKYTALFIDSLVKSKQLPIDDSDVEIIKFLSRIHDIGKLCLSDKCLVEASDLSLAEVEIVSAHTVFGAEMVRTAMGVATQNSFFNHAYNICRSHHERWDGKGYPDKLMTTSIPIEARIIAIVNSYDNFRNPKSGTEPLSHAEAINRIRFWSGTHFDPDLVDAFTLIEKQIEEMTF